MHYYKFNIADYRKDAGHLSHLEHGIYRQVLDEYYLHEKPIKTDWVIRRLRLVSELEVQSLQNVLCDFFEHDSHTDTWTHKRADDEIAQYNKRAETARANGTSGGRPKNAQKTKSVSKGNQEQTQKKANSLTNKPLTNNIINSAFERFWCAGLTKKNKARAQPVFEKIMHARFDSSTEDQAEEFINMLVQDIKIRKERNQLGFDELHPGTYLNNQRWEDELPPEQIPQGVQYANSQSGNQRGQQQRLSTIEQSTAVNRANHERLQREIEELEAREGHDRAVGVANA